MPALRTQLEALEPQSHVSLALGVTAFGSVSAASSSTLRERHMPVFALNLPLGHRWLWSPEPYCLAASLLGQKKQAPCFLLVSQNNRAVTLCCCNGGWMDCCGCQGWGKERRGGTGSRELGAVDRRGHGVRQLEETWQG